MESAAKIKEILQAAELEKLPDFIAAYQEDPSCLLYTSDAADE